MLLEKLNKIVSTEIKINILPRMIVSVFIILLVKTFFGFSNLNDIESLLPLERFIPLIGLIFIMPILEPELDYNIYQVIKTKQTSLILVYIIKLVIALIIYSIFIIGTLYYMENNNSIISYRDYFIQTLSIGVFLGSIGFMFIAITQNQIYGMLVSLSYYLANWFVSYERLGICYLFRLSRELAPLIEFKLFLSLIFIIIGLIIYIRRKS